MKHTYAWRYTSSNPYVLVDAFDALCKGCCDCCSAASAAQLLQLLQLPVMHLHAADLWHFATHLLLPQTDTDVDQLI